MADMTDRRDFYCYALLRPDGTPFYVGRGCGHRLRRHAKAAMNGERSYKANIIRKIVRDGGEVGYMFFATNLTSMEARVKEVEMISTIGRLPNGPLVNLTAGGEGMADPSDETRAKLSAAHKGRKMSAEAIAKRVMTRKGFRHTLESRAKMSAALKGRKQSKAARKKRALSMIGYKHSPETRAKMRNVYTPEMRAKHSAKLKGRKHSPEHRANLSAALMGHQLSSETRAKISAAAKKRRHSPETRAKISASVKRAKENPLWQ